MRSSLLVSLGTLAFISSTSALAKTADNADSQINATSAASETTPMVFRVGGEAAHQLRTVERNGEVYYFAGPCRITTPLPQGYPPPTVPGAIEIKYYPTVRRAEAAGGGGRDDGMRGARTTGAFWPLFQHIQSRDIAMTAPVEMDYRDYNAEAGTAEGGWSMSFLYRTRDLGPEGEDGRIKIYDTEPVIVLSIGTKGDSMGRGLKKHIAYLEDWVAQSEDWEIAGDPRSFGYNGPDALPQHRWGEVQLPIRAIERPDEELAASE